MAYLLATPHGPHRRPSGSCACATLVVGVAHDGQRAGMGGAPVVAASGSRSCGRSAPSAPSPRRPRSTVARQPPAGPARPARGLRRPGRGPRVTAACGLASVLAVVVVDATSPGPVSQADVFMRLAALVGVSLLALASSRNRRRLERHQRQPRAPAGAAGDRRQPHGCWNRRAFNERLAQEIQRAVRHHRPLSDRHDRRRPVQGRQRRPRAIWWATSSWHGSGKALRRLARATDIVGRLGGDEFVVLMPDTNPAAAVNQAVRLRHALPGSAPVPVTLSVGIAGLDRNEPAAEVPPARRRTPASTRSSAAAATGSACSEAERPVARRVG